MTKNRTKPEVKPNISPLTHITIQGAREHNLKNITVSIPKGAFTVITGPSGSGKSSLALDVLYAEGKRRYLESLPSYARQFLGLNRKPDVDQIDGLCPSIAIEQKTVGSNPRSTVGTITEIYDYLRVLYARVGIAQCPDCHIPVSAQSADSVVAAIEKDFSGQAVLFTAPLVTNKKGEFKKMLAELFAVGFNRFIIDGQRHKFSSIADINAIQLLKTYAHTIHLLVDHIEIKPNEHSRIKEAVVTAFAKARGMCEVMVGDEKRLYSTERTCVRCGESVPELEPRIFSFNSPLGACSECNGLGAYYMFSLTDEKEASLQSKDYSSGFFESQCQECFGQRLNKYARAVVVDGKTLFELCQLSVEELLLCLRGIVFLPASAEIAAPLVAEVIRRLIFLVDVGLGYLSLNRTARTLSGGEGQRIRLAAQLGSALTGVLYVLDEPSIGLHQRDNDKLLATLKKLRDLGNTVLVVEHDLDTMLHADYLIDMGPAAGVLGGEVVATGTPQELIKNPISLSGRYLAGLYEIPIPQSVRKKKGVLKFSHLKRNNLKDVSVEIPLGIMTAITGVSGSGKSTLVMNEFVNRLKRYLSLPYSIKAEPVDFITGDLKEIENLVVIDQAPIGRTPRSNPATYLGIFDDIRKIFASLPEANARGYTVGHFSFNVASGRCQTCRGEGSVTISMQFLPDVVMICKDCNGLRYSKSTLEIRFKNKSIADVLAMTAFEALDFFSVHKSVQKRLQLLCDVGLDYIALGQSALTLSGGEAQRIKLVDELAKRGSKTMYVLDEPTTGLHIDDVLKLLKVLNRLVDKGNSMIVIEHNLDFIKTADYVIDLGPEGGSKGGAIVAVGTPKEIAQQKIGHTAHYLAHYFKKK